MNRDWHFSANDSRHSRYSPPSSSYSPPHTQLLHHHHHHYQNYPPPRLKLALVESIVWGILQMTVWMSRAGGKRQCGGDCDMGVGVEGSGGEKGVEGSCEAFLPNPLLKYLERQEKAQPARLSLNLQLFFFFKTCTHGHCVFPRSHAMLIRPRLFRSRPLSVNHNSRSQESLLALEWLLITEHRAYCLHLSLCWEAGSLHGSLKHNT